MLSSFNFAKIPNHAMQKKHEAATRANFLLDTKSSGRLDIDWTRYLAYLGVDSTREFAT